MTAPLAEVVKEGRRLEQAYDDAIRHELDSEAHALYEARCAFFDEHGPRLLAVAAAAVEMREAAKNDMNESAALGCGVDSRLEAALAAFDAAARGEK